MKLPGLELPRVLSDALADCRQHFIGAAVFSFLINILSLAPTLWEWKRGEGFTLPITHDRKAQIAAVVAERSFLKIVRFLPLGDPRVQSGALAELSQDVFRTMLPIVIL